MFKKLLLTFMLASSTTWAADAIWLTHAPDFYVNHGKADQVLNAFNTTIWKIAAKASADSADPYYFISARTVGLSGGGQTDYLSQMYTAAKGGWRWVLRDNTGATTSSGNLQVAPGVSPVIQIGLSATSSSFDTADPDRPKFHLNKADYHLGTITLTLSGKSSPGEFCFGATNVSSTFPNCPVRYDFNGNGQHNWKLLIQVLDATELLPTSSGNVGSTF